MSSSSFALLSFAEKEEVNEHDNTIYKYLSDAGIDYEEVSNWGKIGSLIEAINEDEGSNHDCRLGKEFIDFVSKLPPGNTPKPIIKHQMQRAPNV